MTPPRDTRRIQFAAVGLAFALFGAIDLIVLLFTPEPERGVALLPPIFSGIIVLVSLPFLLALFEKQQVRIERQATEIETLHAMDAAIFSEMELPRLLPVAVGKALTACDAEASGVALFDASTGKIVNELQRLPDVTSDSEQAQFLTLVRTGSATGDEDWETLVAPLTGNTSDPPLGYLLVARRRGNNRPFSSTDRRLLTALSGTLRIAVTNARALKAAREMQAVRDELKETQKQQQRDQAIARAMTEGLLPEIPERIGSWCFSQQYQAQSDEAPVGGDLYDLFQIAPQIWGVFIADVSGKGLVAARKIALVKYALRSYAREHFAPSVVLNHLNQTLFDEPELTGFVTLFYAVIDESRQEICWASAGHETPILRRVTGDSELLNPTGPVLGAIDEASYTEKRTIFYPGDGLLLFTDGLSEARSALNRKNLFGIVGVQRALESILKSSETAMSLIPVADAIMTNLHQFTGGHLSDDTALIWLQYAPLATHTVD